MDSIRKALNNDCSRGKNSLIAKIRLLMNTENGAEKVFVLVEGSDDKKFFDKIFGNNVFILESVGGKQGLYDLLKAEEINNKRVIAVRDRDYSNPEEYPERMFAYDFCSLELMLLFHPQIQNSLKNFCVLEEDKSDFPLHAMRCIAPFSILREKNEKEQLKLCLRKGVLAGLHNQSDKYPNMQLLFHNLAVDEKLFAICAEKAKTVSDSRLWDITNGHDICLILARISRSTGLNFGEDKYRLLMISMYRKEDFSSTNLCKMLLQYQKKHNICIFSDRGEHG